MRDYPAIARQYVDDILGGRIPACAWVHRACQRQRDDMERWADDAAPWRFDESRASDVCRFVELLPHIKGPLAGQLIRLEPWQIFILASIFGWVNAAGLRRFRRVYIEVPRGSGKSALSSAVALYMLAADGEGGAEVYSFATTRDQARIVFNDAQHMARRTPGLKRHFGVEVNAHAIHVVKTASKFEPLAAEGSTLDGLNIHFACVDELHAHKTRAVYDVVETGTGKRDQSLLWVITTAGSNRSGICYEVRTFVAEVLKGVAQDDTQFGIVYGLDDEDDWTTEESLIKANPNWGVSVMPNVLTPLQRKAMIMPSAANNFQTKHLNRWVNADTAWLDMRAWDRAGNPLLTIDKVRHLPAWIGLDLASKVDIAAAPILFYDPRESRYYLITSGRFWLPERQVEGGGNSQYSGWVRSGHLVSTPGEVTDYDFIEQQLRDDAAFLHDLREVPFDPWQATHLSNRLMGEGLPMVEYRQTVQNMSEPMKTLEALILEGRLEHDGNPAMAWMMSNVVGHLDAKDNIYPRKERPENKIDGPIGVMMALGRSIFEVQKPSIDAFLSDPLIG